MASTTVEIKLVDYPAVRDALDAGADLAKAVKAALCDENIEDTRASLILRNALAVSIGR